MHYANLFRPIHDLEVISFDWRHDAKLALFCRKYSIYNIMHLYVTHSFGIIVILRNWSSIQDVFKLWFKFVLPNLPHHIHLAISYVLMNHKCYAFISIDLINLGSICWYHFIPLSCNNVRAFCRGRCYFSSVCICFWKQGSHCYTVCIVLESNEKKKQYDSMFQMFQDFFEITRCFWLSTVILYFIWVNF